MSKIKSWLMDEAEDQTDGDIEALIEQLGGEDES